MEFLKKLDSQSCLADYESDYEKAVYLQNLLINRATHVTASEDDYKILRSYFISKPVLNSLLPKFLKLSRDFNQFWNFISEYSKQYKPRRQYISNEFTPLLDYLENNPSDLPYKDIVTNKINFLDSVYINDSWQKIMDRKNTDFEGAITSARTLLESVLKSILDDMGEKTNSSGDLIKLYKEVADKLNLSPNNHNEQVFKQILGGCSSIVNGIASLRNEYGDSHGKGQTVYKPAQRHTDLAVNMACAMALFLIQTYENNKINK